MDVEATRLEFKPAVITTLFVGESAPASGDFFYFGNTDMTRHMRTAIESHCGPSDDFLQTFKSYGWYLDDLVLTPVNKLTASERVTMCQAAQGSLAERILRYRPQAIVTVLKRIADDVKAAAHIAGYQGPLHVVSFPGVGQQGRFFEEMKAVLPKLPRIQ